MSGFKPTARTWGSRLALAAIAGAAAFNPAAAAAMHLAAMPTTEPELVAQALGALDADRHDDARAELRLAIADRDEPAAARDHARDALAALRAGGLPTAIAHATDGAAVEHFTYALRAARAGHYTGVDSASDHLRQATALVPYAREARAALHHIAHHRRAEARRAIQQGLLAATIAM